MRDSHAAAEQAMMEQIEGLKQIHADEIAEREKALQEYKERVVEIEERYINAQDEIERLSQEDQCPPHHRRARQGNYRPVRARLDSGQERV